MTPLINGLKQIDMNIGDKAPEVLGTDEQGRDIRLSDYKGRKLVLYFYPKDNTSGCTAEACSLRDHYDELQGRGYEVVGVSKDSAASHVKFKEKHELPFPLIADVDHTLLETMGAWGEKHGLSQLCFSLQSQAQRGKENMAKQEVDFRQCSFQGDSRQAG